MVSRKEQILTILSKEGTLSNSQIAQELSIELSYCSKIIKNLVKEKKVLVIVKQNGRIRTQFVSLDHSLNDQSLNNSPLKDTISKQNSDHNDHSLNDQSSNDHSLNDQSSNNSPLKDTISKQNSDHNDQSLNDQSLKTKKKINPVNNNQKITKPPENLVKPPVINYSDKNLEEKFEAFKRDINLKIALFNKSQSTNQVPQEVKNALLLLLQADYRRFIRYNYGNYVDYVETIANYFNITLTKPKEKPKKVDLQKSGDVKLDLFHE